MQFPNGVIWQPKCVHTEVQPCRGVAASWIPLSLAQAPLRNSFKHRE